MGYENWKSDKEEAKDSPAMDSLIDALKYERYSSCDAESIERDLELHKDD